MLLTVRAATPTHVLLSTPEGATLRAPQTHPPLPSGSRLLAWAVPSSGERGPVLEFRPLAASEWFLRRLPRLARPEPVSAPHLAPMLLVRHAPRLRELLPSPVPERLAEYLARLPEPQALGSAEGLQSALRRSGLFLEGRLAAGLLGGAPRAEDSEAIEADAGLALRRLAAALREALGRFPAAALREPTDLAAALAELAAQLAPRELERLPPALRRELLRRLSAPGAAAQGEAAEPIDAAGLAVRMLRALRGATEELLARLLEHQHRLAEARERGVPDLQTDLPVRIGDLVELWGIRLWRAPGRSGAKGAGEEERRWRARLDLSLPGLGRLQADIALSLPRRAADVRFRAESDETVERIRAALPRLADGLEALNFSAKRLVVSKGPVRAASASEALPARRLLDEQA